MKIYAALQSDAQQGWVWLQDDTLRPRSIIKITNRNSKKSAYCEALQIDSNFLAEYNKTPRHHINSPSDALVISGWYRSLLVIKHTQIDIDLAIVERNSWWGKFNACIDHPQTVVRVAAWLGLISVGLGFIGVLLGIVSLIG